MRIRFWLPVLLSSSTVAIASCGDDSTVVPADDSTGSSTGASNDSTGDSSSGVDPDSTGAAPECGNGVIAEDEGCDDANVEDGDGCSATCEREPGWQCDGQPTECFAVCGDAIVAGDEQCDDDDIDNGDGCSVECQIEDGWACEGEPSVCATVCGDGFVVGETCDDGNTEDGDGCDAQCEVEDGFECVEAPSACAAICGDGVILGDELCDDGDAAAGDGCDSTCMVELGWSCDGEPSVCMTGCGDGIIAGTEQCDDLGLEDGDGCTAACMLEVGWICMGQPSMCVTECGDGFVAGTEQCDDDGLVADDGCDDMCQIEPGYACEGQPSVCLAVCGDGVLTGTEACDDGNIALGDGCSAACEVDFAWGCAGSPSVCSIVDGLDAMSLGAATGCVLTTLGDVGCFGANTQGEAGNGTTNVETHLPAFALDNAVAITSGENLNCAIRADGTVWCWGDNLLLAMGPGAAAGVDQPSPIEVTGLPVATAIDAGDDHVCVIDDMSQVWCWGNNASLQLGRGGASTADSADPAVVTLPGGLGALDLGLGDDHSCVVLADQTVACWGDDDNGQLGDGAAGADSSVATVVPGLAGIVEVEGGQDDACALDGLGQVWCWGDNIDGQVGNGSNVDASTPQLIGLPSAADAIALGDDFACALLLTDQLFCWGEAEDFQLGSGDLVDVLVPTEVMNTPPEDFVDIEAGGRGACAIAATGERFCWGYSEEGQLGFAPDFQLEPAAPSFSGPLRMLALDPAEYRGVMCGVLLDGTVECAGDGTLVSTSTTQGAQGYFEPISYHLATPTALPINDVQFLAMGNSYLCVRTSTDVQCWGDNSQRQLGQGGTSTTDILTPVPVVGLGVVDELDTGSQHACVRIGGSVQCWGNNSDLQAGEPAVITDQSLPVTVMGLDDAIEVTLGEGHGCALRTTGVVSCWGNDFNGQLGDDDGNTADSGVPVDVTGLPAGVTQVAAGQDHTCALAAGEVYCWGDATYGNLGQGNETDSDTALLVPGLSGIAQIAAGYNYTCALDGAGDMWCWGYSLDGHLGDGGRTLTGLTEVRSPTPFAVASGITDVVAGNGLTCIETAAGWSCLGFRSAGQLGDGTTVEPVFPSATTFGL